MSNEALNTLRQRPAELRELLAGVDAHDRPSYDKAYIVLGYLADRVRRARGYVDETHDQIAEATGLKKRSVETCLRAFDAIGITVVIRPAQPGSAPRRTIPFLEPERSRVDPRAFQRERSRADPCAFQSATVMGSDPERSRVAAERSRADPCPPPVLPPEDLSPSAPPSSDATDVVGDRPSGGKELKKEGEHEQIDRVLAQAAERVAKLREEQGWGKAGPEAIAKLRTQAEEHRDAAGRWLQHPDVTETSAAVAVAGRITGDATAVPHEIRSPYFEAEEATPRPAVTEDGPSATGPAPPSTTTGADPALTEPIDPSEPQPITALIRDNESYQRYISGDTP